MQDLVEYSVVENAKTRFRKFWYQVLLCRPAVRLYDYFYGPQALGHRGEREAERFCLRSGMIVIERGFEDKFGEIDLIAVDRQTVVFIEVKTRTSDYAGSPAEAVDDAKQQHLTKTAHAYLKWNRLTECRVRFDVIGITWPDIHDRATIEHFPNAFEPSGDYQMF